MAAVILVIFIAVPFFFGQGKNTLGEGGDQRTEKHLSHEKPISLSISCVGDIMVHSPQIPAQYREETNTYDFSNNFQYVAPYIREADLALCNMETTFGGESRGYSGYPSFNSPESLATAVREAGWDVAITANNHNMDTGEAGVNGTLATLRKAGLATVGTQYLGEKPYTMVSIKGVNIAIIAYTYETPSTDGRVRINSTPVPLPLEPQINSFDYGTLDTDLGEIGGLIDQARGEKADVVVCYFHWGTEYQTMPNEYQKQMAQEVAAMGADIIFASHPHVLQPMEMIKVSATGKEVPVFYSMGNFISNQRSETLDLPNSKDTEQGIIAEVDFEYMKSTGEILAMEMHAVPLWVDRYNQGKTVYTVVPLDSNLAENPDIQISGHLARARQALADIQNRMGENYVKGN
ncbi:MAG: CapA family protein [Anaerovorax sp.]